MDTERAEVWYTVAEVATLLQVHPETVRRAYRAGELAGVKLGRNLLRFSKSAVEQWMRGQK